MCSVEGNSLLNNEHSDYFFRVMSCVTYYSLHYCVTFAVPSNLVLVLVVFIKIAVSFRELRSCSLPCLTSTQKTQHVTVKQSGLVCALTDSVLWKTIWWRHERQAAHSYLVRTQTEPSATAKKRRRMKMQLLRCLWRFGRDSVRWKRCLKMNLLFLKPKCRL